MKETLKPGLTFSFNYTVPEDKTVPHLFTEFEELALMPKVFATGFMVGLFECACIQALNPHLDWPEEQTVGIGIDASHLAATPPGFTITVRGTLTKVEGKKLTFSIEADDGADKISEATHVRYVIKADKFNAAVAEKALKQAE